MKMRNKRPRRRKTQKRGRPVWAASCAEKYLSVCRQPMRSFLRRTSTPVSASPRRATAEPPSGIAVVWIEALKLKLWPVPSRDQVANALCPSICAVPVPDSEIEPPDENAEVRTVRSNEYVTPPKTNVHWGITGAVRVGVRVLFPVKLKLFTVVDTPPGTPA